MEQERGRIVRKVESESGEGWIEGEHRFKTKDYPYLIWQRGTPASEQDEYGQRGQGERARKAYGVKNPDIVMGWELDPSEHGGQKGVILKDEMLSESRYEPLKPGEEKKAA